MTYKNHNRWTCLCTHFVRDHLMIWYVITWLYELKSIPFPLVHVGGSIGMTNSKPAIIIAGTASPTYLQQTNFEPSTLSHTDAYCYWLTMDALTRILPDHEACAHGNWREFITPCPACTWLKFNHIFWMIHAPEQRFFKSSIQTSQTRLLYFTRLAFKSFLKWAECY